MPVVVVESPAKAKTINKYLGPDFTVLASYGHVRDLPPKDGSVNPDDEFSMSWEVAADSKKHVRAIAEALKTDDTLILATDPDREGEAISWHVRELLAKRKALPKQVDRVTFNAITKQAVTEAMARPRELDQDLIERIEVIPGPGGAVYGQNALFGVINVVTRDGAGLNGTEVAAAWQSPFADFPTLIFP